MAITTYMLDTNICSFIMKSHDENVLGRLQNEVSSGNRIVISSMTYAELRFGSIGKKASTKLPLIIDQFTSRLDAILALDKIAIDQATRVKKELSDKGTNIGYNDTLIAGHALSGNCVLVTNNTKEFIRVSNLVIEDWASPQ